MDIKQMREEAIKAIESSNSLEKLEEAAGKLEDVLKKEIEYVNRIGINLMNVAPLETTCPNLLEKKFAAIKATINNNPIPITIRVVSREFAPSKSALNFVCPIAA